MRLIDSFRRNRRKKRKRALLFQNLCYNNRRALPQSPPILFSEHPRPAFLGDKANAQEKAMPRYAIHTLGCKVNQYESALIGQTLEDAGIVPAAPGERADV